MSEQQKQTLNSTPTQSVTIGVSISDEMSSKLGIAFCGLPDNRQNEIMEDVEKRKVSRNQATFENLLYGQILKYEKKSEQRYEEAAMKTRRLAEIRGVSMADLTALIMASK